jgi:HAE1 family hydrophobic/amphiphilic exporter-1
LQVTGRNGQVPLRNVADVSFGSGPVELNRYDRARQVTLSANLSGISLGDGVKAVNALSALKNLPPDVTQDNFGTAKIMADIFSGFIFALGTGVLFIYAVLVLLFSGFLQPLTIMLALPLSIGGAFAGLLLGNKPLGMMALIGIVMLMGLVTKNSILLVEYAMRHLHQGSKRREALEAAGHDRVRPILMTTIAMTAGMLPIAMSFGEGTESLSPMAVAVIGGLITSTLLTLVVVPSAYTFVDDFQNLLFRLVGRKRKQSAHDQTEPEPPGDRP